mmetsp:Transcript_28573/g.71814  ORF Transcript_28573/g.71814 Transcript_28573/m.71814 type:complete len:220 (-) Transcript_28573:205-864(-)
MLVSLTYLSSPSWSGKRRRTARSHLSDGMSPPGAAPALARAVAFAAAAAAAAAAIVGAAAADRVAVGAGEAPAANKPSSLSKGTDGGGKGSKVGDAEPASSSRKLVPTWSTSEAGPRASSKSLPASSVKSMGDSVCCTSVGTVVRSGLVITEGVLMTMKSSSESPPSGLRAAAAMILATDAGATGAEGPRRGEGCGDGCREESCEACCNDAAAAREAAL